MRQFEPKLVIEKKLQDSFNCSNGCPSSSVKALTIDNQLLYTFKSVKHRSMRYSLLSKLNALPIFLCFIICSYLYNHMNVNELSKDTMKVIHNVHITKITDCICL